MINMEIIIKIEIPDEDAEKIQNVKNAIDYINKAS
jgi:acyl carrier protein